MANALNAEEEDGSTPITQHTTMKGNTPSLGLLFTALAALLMGIGTCQPSVKK